MDKNYFKEELVLLEKSKYDMLLFQIGEGKMTERSLKKQMEQMEMDNYLANIDLIRMKNQIDAYKSNKRASSINNNFNNNLDLHRGSNKSSSKNIDWLLPFRVLPLPSMTILLLSIVIPL